MPNYFSPLPGRLGVFPVPFQSGRINTGTLAAGTQNHNIGGFAPKCYINRGSVCAATFPTAATSCVITVYKMTGATALALTNSVDINTKTADTPIVFSFISTLTEAERTLQPGDSIRVTLVTVGGVSVQPIDITVNLELLVEN